MTLQEWNAQAIASLAAAGFQAEERAGLVWLPHPPDERKLEFLELRLPFSCERRIYAEGVLVLPLL